ncbi:MAG: 2-hydroxyacyl-CoA dehydratase [Chloroflexi bacterium]|nr:2-hydroxyacyl-CoA dehydratase [Chloroflexota bacterium]
MRMQPRRWETRPLQCWDKAKEIRRKYERARVEAAGKHQQLVDGMDALIFAALGNLQAVMTNPLGAMIANASNKFSRECLAEAECRGFGRDVCGYHREIFGSMFLDRDIQGGHFPRRDISIPTPAPCDQHSKRGQPVADYFGIPRFQGEAPVYMGNFDPDRDRMMLEHRVAEVLEQIEWLEKVTGRRFDDEVFAEGVKSNMRLKSLAGDVYCLNQNTPAPLDQKSLYSFFTLGGLVKGDQNATEELWRELRDETRWRVEKKIAAVATERYRWVEDMPPPWYFLKYYRYMEKYGAVCIGSPYTHMIGAPYEWRDGEYVSARTPLDLNWSMNTREELVRAHAVTFIRPGHYTDIAGANQNLLDMARAYHCEGAIMPLWHSGVGCVYGHSENGQALAEDGVRVMYYEGCQPGDRTDFDENRMLDQLDHWMESQGLKKLED